MSGSFPRYGSFRKRLDAFARELAGVEEGNVEALHRTRVASRRLRELLPLLELNRDTTQKLNRRLRKVTKQLGTVRDLDVLKLLIEELERDSRHSLAALRQVSSTLTRERVVARKRLAATLPIVKLERLAHKLERVAEHLESSETQSARPGTSGPKRAWRWALDARLARRAAGLESAIEAAGTVYVSQHLHAVRIAVKKLRYAAELPTEGRPGRATADIRSLKSTQDLLGRLHDLEALLGWGREVQASLSAPDLTMWRNLDSLVRAVEDDCRQLHARYMSDRTKLMAIVGRMGASPANAPLVGRRAAS